MHSIISIEFVEERTNKSGEIYYRTHAILDDGSEVVGFGRDFKVGDKVESYYREEWDQHQMRRPK